MKNFHLIFFLICLTPIVIPAQNNVIPAQEKNVKQNKTTIKISSQGTRPALTKGKQVSKGIIKRKTGTSHKRKRLSTNTVYGNEWINYSQKYYKIRVGSSAIYRIDSLTLAKAGIPVDTINSRHYQVFFRGQQQYIYVKSRTSYLNERNGDYIEFYGQYNDGSTDSTVYYNIKFLPDPYYSLFSDTSTYYLTWNSSGPYLRMTEQTDTSFGSYGPAQPYVIAPTVVGGRAYSTAPSNNLASNIYLQNPLNNYFPGAQYQDGTYTPNDPRFTQNVVWQDGWIEYGGSGTLTPQVDNVYSGSGAPAAFLRTVLLGVYKGICTLNIAANGVGTLLSGYTMNGFGALDTSFTFPASDVSSGFNVTYTNNATSNSNIISPAYIYLSYPHTPDLNGESTYFMNIPDNNNSLFTKAYFSFTNFSTNTAADSVRLYDLTNHNRFWVKLGGGGYNVVIPNSGGLKQCYITSDSSVIKVTSITPVGSNTDGTFTNFTTEPGNTYVIITNHLLWSGAQAYAAYRGSPAGGNYVPVVADAVELFDQFGYGVYNSPLGIRRYCNYAIDKWNDIPAYLFIIGKGIHTPLIRPDTSRWTRGQLFVPSFGNPSSDILFSNGLGGDTLLEPAIPTGRLAAESNAEVNTYLSKVQTYESTPPALWMKNVAHFAGGENAAGELGFLLFLNAYASTISDTLFGAHVYTFQKSSPLPISGSLTDSIVNLIDTGVSIMTFFGHAGGANWDESISYPSDYQNNGKYPFIIANACFSGDIFEPIGGALTSVSEDFVLGSPGAIGFLASDYLGDPFELNNYTTQLYNDFSFTPFYRKSIGKIIQNTVETYQTFPQIFMAFTNLEMTLHGDPAITINAKDSLPDYAVNNQSIYFTPANVTVLQDSFNVNVVVSNIAEALYQLVPGTLTRVFPDGTPVHYSFSFNHIFYQDTVSIRIPVNDSTIRSGEGLNYFTCYVDLNPSIDNELTYGNNSINNPGVPLLISSEDITPVWPYDYAIIPKDTVTLKASTNDPFAPQRTYIFEIDTSHSFNSKLFRSDTVSLSGGVIKVSPYDWKFPEDTIHYNGLEKRYIISGANKPNSKGVDKNSNPMAFENEGTVKLNDKLTNFAPGRPVIEQRVSQTGSKPAANLNGTRFTQPKANQELRNNLALEKMKYARSPVKDTFINGAVYYWRVRRDTADLKTYPWVMSSFQYIKNQNGWGQSNFFQFNNDEVFNDNYNFINFNNAPRNWTFNANGQTLACFTYGMIDINATELDGTEYLINNFVEGYAGCQIYQGIYIAVIDSLTLIPWSTDQYDYGNANDSISYRTNGCAYPDSKFIFWDNSGVQTGNLVRMLNSVPRGDYILAYSWVEGEFKAPALTNDSLVVATFQNLGATQMIYHRTTPGLDSVPWIFFVQKGHAGSAMERYGRTPSDSSPVTLFALLKSNGTYGAITTPLIGPSTKFDSLSWFQHPYEGSPLTDSTRLNVIGIEPSGRARTLMSNINPAVVNLYLSSINPVLFPYIQLVLFTKDIVHHTPGQMNFWRVFYQPVPEVAMNPNIYTYYHADSLQYGDTIRFQTVVQNISDWPIDSTRLLTWITNSTNNINYVSNKYTYNTVKKLNPGDTAKISMWMPDVNAGANTLKSVWFEVNPESYPDTRLEQYHFNDYATRNFYSYGDKINPVLDVTFNGIHILNNDIVSPQPTILITFMDENKFLAMNNPNDFKVYLNSVTNPTPQLVPYGPTLSFTPAVLPQNRCSMLFTPALTDGTYQLTVQGNDISGNLSANNSYKINFEVITKSMISEVLNYPNPFSTSTRFVFVLTGEQIPTIFKIQIMTVTGKIVREINEDEIGPIHIGRNITQYAWDGTDEYGTKLANGVYLYRVVTSVNGENMDDYKTAADQYFTKGWGKMYLMR